MTTFIPDAEHRLVEVVHSFLKGKGKPEDVTRAFEQFPRASFPVNVRIQSELMLVRLRKHSDAASIVARLHLLRTCVVSVN